MQRAHALPADWVRRNIEVGSETQSFWTIHNLSQGLIVNVTQGRMEKAGSHLARCFYHRRNPRGVTVWSHVSCLLKVSAEVKDNTAQFVARFDHKSRVHFDSVLDH